MSFHIGFISILLEELETIAPGLRRSYDLDQPDVLVSSSTDN